MAITRISGNQIADTTEAVITTLSFLNTNSVFRLPTGTEAQRPSGVSVGTMRFNTTADSAEVYANDDGSGNAGWIEVGAGGAVVGDKGQIRCNNDTIEENLDLDPTIGNEFKIGYMAGDVTVGNGYTLTIGSGATLFMIGSDPYT